MAMAAKPALASVFAAPKSTDLSTVKPCWKMTTGQGPGELGMVIRNGTVWTLWTAGRPVAALMEKCAVMAPGGVVGATPMAPPAPMPPLELR